MTRKRAKRGESASERKSKECLDAIYRGLRSKDVVEITGLSASAVSHFLTRYAIERHLLVIHPTNQKWVRDNMPEGLTMSEFLNSLITDARFEDEEDGD